MKEQTRIELENYIEEILTGADARGAALGVVNADGKVLYQRFFGWRDAERQLPIDADTIFGIASVTKSFTALAIMQLQEAGILSLEDPVAKYVPEYKDPVGRPPVRIWHLLCHSGGFFPLPRLVVDKIAQEMGISDSIQEELVYRKDFAEQGIPFVFRCSNRLDRDTSGLTVVAKHAISGNLLSTMMARREIHREYLAIVAGAVTPPSGRIDAPLGRKPGSVIERTVDWENGERAVTHYELVQPLQGHSLIRLRLETGRTHQIRIHMKYLGYPLIGDYLYHPDMTWISRQALHSAKLSFTHPITGEPMCFEAPLPEDMQHAVDELSL